MGLTEEYRQGQLFASFTLFLKLVTTDVDCFVIY